MQLLQPMYKIDSNSIVCDLFIENVFHKNLHNHSVEKKTKQKLQNKKQA